MLLVVKLIPHIQFNIRIKLMEFYPKYILIVKIYLVKYIPYIY